MTPVDLSCDHLVGAPCPLCAAEAADEALVRGLLEKFVDPDGVERVRLTPAGARAIGAEALARHLEECKAGRHVRWIGGCVCGETRFPS